MQVKSLYDKEITRRVNPAVVATVGDSNEIRQEIREYIFTEEIINELYKFFEACLIGQKGKTGVWINGYYGSGKSHFIKYLFYCLNTNEYPEAFERYMDSISIFNDPLDGPSRSELSTVKSHIEKTEFELDLFNIDAVSGQEGFGTASDKTRITRILLNRLNALRGYNNFNPSLAFGLEKVLDRKGKFEAFQAGLKDSIGEPWIGNERMYIESFLADVLKEAQNQIPNLDLESLRNSISKDGDKNIDFFIEELNDYISTKEKHYRLIFFMDEVSKYIGQNQNLLLNLQTIVEQVGEKCDNKVWLVCTAQQSLKEMMDTAGASADSFGQILGRFETRISLQGTDTPMIVKKRLLEKNANGYGVLDEFFGANKQAIENQYHFENQVYQSYASKEDFILTYPFVPYQFQLISDVFASFSQLGFVGQGVKNTERAILGTTHSTAKENQDDELGKFISFDKFFNNQLKENLTHIATNIITKANNLPEVQSNDIYQRVVKALFMISNLSDAYAVGFPANAENLALLLMNNLNDSKADLMKQIQPALDYLESNFIIQLRDGKYRFLSDDEITVAEMIKNERPTLDDKLKYIYEDLIRPIFRPSTSVSFGNKNLKLQLKVDDKEINNKADLTVQFITNSTKSSHEIAMSGRANDLYIPLSLIMNNDEDLKRGINNYVKTQKFISTNRSNADDKRKKTLDRFKDLNATRIESVRNKIIQHFSSIDVISGQEVKSPDNFGASESKSRYKEILENHLGSLYRKSNLAERYATTPDALRTNAKLPMQSSTELTPAEGEVESVIKFKGLDILGDLIKEFEKPPYGWRDISTIDIVMSLIRKRIRLSKYHNDPIDHLGFVEKAISSSNRNHISIHSDNAMDVQPYTQKINDALGTMVVPTTINDKYEFLSTFKKNSKASITEINQLKENTKSYLFNERIRSYHSALLQLHECTAPEQLFQKIDALGNLTDLRDFAVQAQEFYLEQIDKYNKLIQFAIANENNLRTIPDIDESLLNEFLQYASTDSQPWVNYPKMLKAYKQFKQLTADSLDRLKQRTKALYEDAREQALKEISAMEGDVAYVPPLEQLQSEIDRLTSIDKLKIKANEVQRYKTKIITKATPQKKIKEFVISQEMGSKSLSTIKGIDNYVAELKRKLKSELDDGVDAIIIS